MNEHLFDCLDPVQLGFVYESLMKNANDGGLNAASSKVYIEWAGHVRAAIEGNCGWDDYLQHHQKLCQKLADYNGRLYGGV